MGYVLGVNEVAGKFLGGLRGLGSLGVWFLLTSLFFVFLGEVWKTKEKWTSS